MSQFGIMHHARPWSPLGPARVKHAVLLVSAICLFAELKNTTERREYLALSEVPLFPNPVAVFTRADRKLAFSRWDDLNCLRGGANVGQRFGGGLDEFVTGRLTVEPASHISENFSKLARGRIDYFINSYYPALAAMLRSGEVRRILEDNVDRLRRSNTREPIRSAVSHSGA